MAYEMSQRSQATAHGGMGLIAKLVDSVGLAGEIDSSLQLLQVHRPYFEIRITSSPRQTGYVES